ncbi:unnamed protein product (macronuclear) [Paramecium tetraurelia]|uniref:Protein kinase domain-containing protein n=1 Tax=Paramecium tetraurelia TaxID=5888 RepID=A0BSJ0_PARTE|nr:uncharacterized protein GSPATT00031739001 [Paramecium tetraurelia]CAK61507.1 unnamed protein product [Paramecium tetraurelia]|eukprot:XP_001428905.1 hypothetical protein (macronuclear) [Paramecium tetraurelia strain d4-2]
MDQKKVGNYYLFYNKLLGKGALGEVIVGQRIADNKLVAVKIIKKQYLEGKQNFEKYYILFESELDQKGAFKEKLSSKSPSIIKISFRCTKQKNLAIIFTCSWNQENVHSRITNKNVHIIFAFQDKLTNEDVKKIMIQLLQALHHMVNFKLTNPLQNNKEYRGICHLDLKPQNILMIGDIPKITDFGMSIQMNNDQPSEISTMTEELSQTHHFYLGKGSLV